MRLGVRLEAFLVDLVHVAEPIARRRSQRRVDGVRGHHVRAPAVVTASQQTAAGVKSRPAVVAHVDPPWKCDAGEYRTSMARMNAITGPWIMTQTWVNLLFAHWPLSPATLRPLVPESLALDTFDGEAWIAVAPFVIESLRFRGAPGVPGLSRFPEINVRTYVRHGDKPGVFFFSLDAGSSLAVISARRFYALPYFPAAFEITERDGWFHYASRRTQRSAAPAECNVSYRPRSRVRDATPPALAEWLTERYCLYAVDRRGRVRCADILHERWPLQDAEVEFRTNTMTRGLGITLPDVAPLAHFSRRLDVRVWAPHVVSSGRSCPPKESRSWRHRS
jgi:hypothetical protein